ncbi:MAG: IS3 family transposase [Verrucomicrobiaceae bacterium]|nr:IS3 family transposase [Verrucomicrobiaceae bacterium]
MNTTGTKKRTYDEQFKRDAVALLEGGRKAAQLARELGISHWNLRDWKERYGTGAAAVSQPQARSAGLVNAGGSSAVAAAVEIASLRRELDAIRAQNDILKKSLGHSSPTRRHRFVLIQTLHHEQPRMSLAKACRALGVSRSGYHAHLRKQQRPRRRQDAQLATEIHAAFIASRATYGSPRLVHALRAKGLRHGNNRIARLMREQHLRVRQKRRFVPRTTVTDKTAATAPNHLLQRPAPNRLNEVWVTDITYLPTREGWLYLAAEMDLCSRRILGWSTRETLATELPNAALSAPCKHVEQTRAVCSTIATVAANTPAPSSASASNCAASPPA